MGRKGIGLSRSPRSAVHSVGTGKMEALGNSGQKNLVPTTTAVTLVKPEPRFLQVPSTSVPTCKSPIKQRSPRNGSQSSRSLFSKDKIHRIGEKSAFVGKSRFEPVVNPLVAGNKTAAEIDGFSSFPSLTAKSGLSSAVDSERLSTITSVSSARHTNSVNTSHNTRMKGPGCVSPTMQDVAIVPEKTRTGEKRLSSETQDQIAPKKMKSLNGEYRIQFTAELFSALTACSCIHLLMMK